MKDLRTVPNYPKYKVDLNTGEIFAVKSYGMKALKPTLAPSGYLTVTLYNNGKSKSTTVHCVVMAAHLGTWDWNKPEVDHKDHNRQNNSIHNLQLATRSDQMDDIVKSKLSIAMQGNNYHDKEAISKAVQGELNTKAKLTEETVLGIRKAFDVYEGDRSKYVRLAAKRYNVSESSVYRVLARKTWKFI